MLFFVLYLLLIYLIISAIIKRNKKRSEDRKRKRWAKIKEEYELSKIDNFYNENIEETEGKDNHSKKTTSNSKPIFGYVKSFDNYSYEEEKGKLGEQDILRHLRRLKVHHRLLNNIYIQKKGYSSEIDIILITLTGIYVIESKNYNGWIFGREQDDKWTQSFSKKSKFQFYNPVKQNYGHILAIKSVLDNKVNLDSQAYNSYVIFGDNCQLKSIEVESSKVFQLRDLQYFSNLDFKRKSLLNVKQIDKIYNILKPYENASEEIKKKHNMLTIKKQQK